SIGLSNWKKNQTSKQIVTQLLNEFSDRSKFTLHFYHTKTHILVENLSKQEVRNKLQEMELANENDLLSSLEDIYKKIAKHQDLHIVIAPSDTKTGDVSRSLSQRKETQKFPILFIAIDSLTYKAVASLSNGKFISINDLNLNSEVREYLSKFHKPFVILEYESTLGEILNSFFFPNVDVEISIGNKKFQTAYTITPITILLGWFSNVQVVLLILLITLAFLLLVAYARYQRNKRIQWEEYLKKQEELRKSDLYYHENVASYRDEDQNVKIISSRDVTEDEWQKFEEEELELDLSFSEQEEDLETADLPKGESYEKAFFIQKEGPNPGRQFFINKEETIIGRDPQVDLVLLDSTVSLRHAKIK
ncbi:MAG: FHA domain-containing protein, partial [Leptospiraceae bacterium]|nr:FHA domain-containing protein [Leptospiraceae bacterium]